MLVCDTDEEARRLWAEGGLFCGREWFAPFGFGLGLRDPDTGEENTDLFEDQLLLVGSVETVTNQLRKLRQRLPVEWIFAWCYNGLVPHETLMKSIELYQTKVVPAVMAEG
jgi:alkanesulfonate monooxygenase SsuD/methylene tetrahydromethanopterin reductase-like flavin-dependent oxidoreductase (luciferase family)